MRTSQPPDQEDLETALDYAIAGAVVTDSGMPTGVEAALEKVRLAAPNPPQYLIDAARRAFQQSLGG